MPEEERVEAPGRGRDVAQEVLESALGGHENGEAEIGFVTGCLGEDVEERRAEIEELREAG